MARPEYPVTPAVRFLRDHGIAFEPHLYPYEDRGGTSHAAKALKVPEHCVIKTLVMEADNRTPLLVLMHGDCEVSTRRLARIIGAKHIVPCDPSAAHRLTGYLVGGTSPFGTRSSLPVYAERSIFSLERIYINGGKRGFLVAMQPAELPGLLQLFPVDIAIQNGYIA